MILVSFIFCFIGEHKIRVRFYVIVTVLKFCSKMGGNNPLKGAKVVAAKVAVDDPESLNSRFLVL